MEQEQHVAFKPEAFQVDERKKKKRKKRERKKGGFIKEKQCQEKVTINEEMR